MRAGQSVASYQRELASARALKERYRGVCVECGCKTTGCHGPGKAPTLCYRCSPRIVVAPQVRGTGPRQRELMALLADGPQRFMAISRAIGMPKTSMGQLLGRLMAHGLIERVSRGVYRSTVTPAEDGAPLTSNREKATFDAQPQP